MAATFIVFALLFVACSYASPLRMMSMYGSPILIPVLVQELDDPQALINKESVYALNDDSKVANSIAIPNIEKRSVEEANDDDLEIAAGTNVLRPLFVYRQQVAYRQRARERAARSRGRRI
ncbi:hypothetical protein ALC56_02552 [Trachymyrmex septentrionalis]|uniref:Uncharacterized protein n=1 Tax=Trachymyrmex septentrionalis TaxID=34720 RepID=A0A195FQ85_9HYME|nr:PREDICTED: uncharacterized protein LOC108745544 [Trachymyrmex septentrionalis]KYN42750.1 hypothetical protein ALC56_02552 [Trachymyrmex septentrionalis]